MSKLSDQSAEERDHRGHVAWRVFYEAAKQPDFDTDYWHKLSEESREPWRLAAESTAQKYYEELVRVQTIVQRAIAASDNGGGSAGDAIQDMLGILREAGVNEKDSDVSTPDPRLPHAVDLMKQTKRFAQTPPLLLPGDNIEDAVRLMAGIFLCASDESGIAIETMITEWDNELLVVVECGEGFTIVRPDAPS